MTAHTPWFRRLFGFDEADWHATRARFRVDGERLHSLANGREFELGRFSLPTVAGLRALHRQAARASSEAGAPSDALQLRVTHEVIGDVLPLHALDENRGATFQAASQFNCLEFIDPTRTPEHGVTCYASDPTQGPACALAAAAGTVFRNYLVPLQGAVGQTRERQIENLAEISRLVPGIVVRNGYTFVDRAALGALGALDRDELIGGVRIGFHSAVGVTFADRWREPIQPTHVSQAYCSAVSCAYQRDVPLMEWEPLATIALDAAYEATLLAAAVDRASGRGSGKVWLTQLGGGVFGNRREWIVGAIARALALCRDMPLDVRIAHFRSLDQRFVAELDMARQAR
ncbi:MAG: hypothetical protein R3F49_09925 [Planctomycetota bacterium]